MALNRLGGPALPDGASLREANVEDGAWLLLTATEDALPEPVVYDVADVVEEELPALQRAGSPQARDLLASLFGGLSLIAAFGLFAAWTPQAVPVAALVIAALCWVASAVIPWRAGLVSRVLSLVPLVVCAWSLIIGTWTMDVRIWIAAGAVLLTQLAREASRRSARSAVAILAVALFTGAAWMLALQLTPRLGDAAAVAGSVSVVLLGLVPRWALGLAGLNSLDDRRARSAEVTRLSVTTSLAAAHRILQSSFVWIGASVALASVLLDDGGPSPAWHISLLAAWALVLLLRLRHFPLVVQRVVLGAAAGVVVVSLFAALAAVLRNPVWTAVGAGVFLLAALALLGSVAIRLPEHIQARQRMLADRAEALIALSMIPILIGGFDVYASLVTTFQK
ncbi:hypothetical protein GCM10009595_02520 [Falsarthrobacter nasiphocae]